MLTDENRSSPVQASVPPGLEDLALLDLPGICLLLCMSANWVRDEIRAGRFPKGRHLGARCRRWTAQEIREWRTNWLAASAADADADAGQRLSEQAKRAGIAGAQARRSKAAAASQAAAA